METTINEIKTVINKYYFVNDRVNELTKLGYYIKKCPMGSGGKGQIKYLRNEIRVQIGYGTSEYNYAMCVILNKSINYVSLNRKIKLNKIFTE